MRTPTGLGLAAMGTAWAVGLPIAAGALIGAATAGAAATGVAIDSALRRRGPSDAAPPPVELHADDERCIRRAESAVGAIDAAVGRLAGGALQDSLRSIARQAAGVLDDLRAVAAQASSARAATRQLDASRLTAELTRLTKQLQDGSGPDVENDLRRSVDAVREQLRVHRRLENATRALRRRIESGTLGLQQMAAQVTEMTALATAETPAHQGERIDELTGQLDALRAGLAVAGAMDGRTGGLGTKGGRDDQVAP